MKCLFLGYSRLQKGYRCYSLETHRYFISADVTFFEDSPFFSTTSESLPVSEVLPIPIVSPPDAMPPRPLQVYHRRPRVVAPLPFPEAPADSLPIPSASPAPALPSPNDLPIAVRKVLRQAMVDEMTALHSNGTWDLVVLPSGKSTVGCRWVYAVKVGPDGQIAFVRLLLSMAAMCSWPLYQLDIKNAFLHGDLAEEVIWSNLLVLLFRGVWFSVQLQQTIQFFIIITPWGSYYLVVYVDDIVITGSDQDDSSIQFWCGPFPKEVCFRHPGRNRYVDCKPVDTPMDPNVKLVPGQGSLRRPGRYRRHWDAVIRILRYIKSTPGQGVLYENRGHTQVVGYTDADWAGSPTDRRSTSGELRFGKDEQMKLICDNQAALHIASNPVFHERTKHIEVDCHFIREKIASGCVATSFVNSNDQLADIFTKSLKVLGLNIFVTSWAYDVYAPA
ncbi:Retrovirus-related Pol polyprotein from transposon RE1 [Vitis vinifera]|uniref:Retrovirus-related Pol polyprotein from transposon RE1 n=1 Tax=Vitis vinifera TaxID=29760 RepID=A0A438JK10_VITVI|nr:Retrovirus-related Pol polyprotein from transposon RE1 [Vitis vinifera]